MMDYTKPKFITHIPYVPGGQLGKEYNRILEKTDSDWILFLDHDVLLCNPHWYRICENAINSLPDAGMFTCYTNAISCQYQKVGQVLPTKGANSSVMDHLKLSEELYNEFGDSYTKVGQISGFFMLISRKAWEDVGGFPGEGFYKEDRNFSGRLLRKGYGIYRLDGLYVYHIYKDKLNFYVEGSNISTDFMNKK